MMYRTKGAAHMRLMEYASAIAAFEKAIVLEPKGKMAALTNEYLRVLRKL